MKQSKSVVKSGIPLFGECSKPMITFRDERTPWEIAKRGAINRALWRNEKAAGVKPVPAVERVDQGARGIGLNTTAHPRSRSAAG